mmetsp:Transcript_20812/g.67007  ORF Transcript_20812/g.67007 Transcript_20812/m.67007 type:complete len:249 (-) Transcript_20812:1189-1935(-)
MGKEGVVGGPPLTGMLKSSSSMSLRASPRAFAPSALCTPWPTSKFSGRAKSRWRRPSLVRSRTWARKTLAKGIGRPRRSSSFGDRSTTRAPESRGRRASLAWAKRRRAWFRWPASSQRAIADRQRPASMIVVEESLAASSTSLTARRQGIALRGVRAAKDSKMAARTGLFVVARPAASAASTRTSALRWFPDRVHAAMSAAKTAASSSWRESSSRRLRRVPGEARNSSKSSRANGVSSASAAATIALA